MTEGWRCPGCSRCYAPSVTECRVCGQVAGQQLVGPPTSTHRDRPGFLQVEPPTDVQKKCSHAVVRTSMPPSCGICFKVLQ